MNPSDYFAPREGGDTVFSVTSRNLKFGAGALEEVGADAKAMGVTRAGVLIDPVVRKTEPAETLLKSLKDAGVEAVAFDHVLCEPNSDSCDEAADFAREAKVDGFISLGGGSTMDTAKAANLLSTHGGKLIDYANAPIGGAKPVPGPVKPHIACPTTCGTGAETTAIIVLDIKDASIPGGHIKTGIANAHLKPHLAVVDPLTIHSLPAGVVASTGFDVLTHAVESYTAKPFTSRPKSGERPPYQGSTPFNDIGAIAAIELGGRYLVRAWKDENDLEARHQLMFAASLAGLAFGTAGVHIPHAMSYPVATLRHDYTADGYQNLPPLTPHGISVVINAPAAFRFTASACPDRHLRAAQAMGADIRNVHERDAGEVLAQTFLSMMRETGLPNGLKDLGFVDADIPALAKGGFAQQRPLTMAPRHVSEEDLVAIYTDAMDYGA